MNSSTRNWVCSVAVQVIVTWSVASTCAAVGAVIAGLTGVLGMTISPAEYAEAVDAASQTLTLNVVAASDAAMVAAGTLSSVDPEVFWTSPACHVESDARQ